MCWSFFIINNNTMWLKTPYSYTDYIYIATLKTCLQWTLLWSIYFYVRTFIFHFKLRSINYFSIFSVLALGIDAFTWQPVTHNVSTTQVWPTNITSKSNVTTTTILTTTPKFTWGPIHNATTTKPTPSSTAPKSTFTWPNLHTTTASGTSGSDLTSIIVCCVMVPVLYILILLILRINREKIYGLFLQMILGNIFICIIFCFWVYLILHF